MWQPCFSILASLVILSFFTLLWTVTSPEVRQLHSLEHTCFQPHLKTKFLAHCLPSPAWMIPTQLWATVKIQCLEILNIKGQLNHSHSCHEGSNTIVPCKQNAALPLCEATALLSRVPDLVMLSLPHPAAPGVSGCLYTRFLHSLFQSPFYLTPLFRVYNFKGHSISSLTLITLFAHQSY